MKILTLGGLGFIGSHVVEQLRKEGHKVGIYDKKNSGNILFPEDLKRKLVGMYSVIHLASLISVPESIRQPRKYFTTNVVGTMNLLEAMRVNDVKKIVFSSSASVYGEPNRTPIFENDEKIPITPYGAYKLAVESIISSYCHSYGMDGVCLRYFNAYGENENHIPETHVIPNFIKACLENKPLKVTGNINNVRDFIYVKDLAEAHVKSLNLTGFHTLNVGSGQGCSIKELIHTLEDLFGKKLNIEYLPPRQGDVRNLVANIDKIKGVLNWKPKTSLKEGLKKTIENVKRIN